MRRNPYLLLIAILSLSLVLFTVYVALSPSQVARSAPPEIRELQGAQTPIPPPQGTPTPAPVANQASSGTNIQINISLQQLVLVGAILLVLVFLFYLQFSYAHRVENSSYLGQLYLEAVEKTEKDRLAAPYNRKWFTQDPQNKWNDYDNDAYSDPKWLSVNPEPRYPGSGPHLTPEQRTQLEAHDTWFFTKLHVQAKTLYDKDLADADQLAKDRAKRASDVDLDIFKGKGPEFVLEFTTIVIIIFTVAILGILGILGNEQIGTILAAIAGYVLGRAVTSRSKDGSQEQTSTPPATNQLAELLQVVAGRGKQADQPPALTITKPVETGQNYSANQATITVEGTASDDNGVTSVKWTRTAADGTTANGAAYLSDGTTSRSWTIQNLPLTEGNNEISVIAQDTSGNQSAPAKITVKYSKSE